MVRDTRMMVDDGGGATPFFSPEDIEWAKSVASNPSGYGQSDLMKAFNILNATGFASLANLIPQVNNVIDQTNELAGTDIERVDNPFNSTVDFSSSSTSSYDNSTGFTNQNNGSSPTVTTTTPTPVAKKVVSTYWNKDGFQVRVYDDGSEQVTDVNNGVAKAARQSAWDLLKATFDGYGLGTLVDGIKNLIEKNVSPSEFLLELRKTDAYQDRFAANAMRIKNGLKALDEATYLGLEDKYSELMRRYGLPAWYTEIGTNGKQANLEQFIANDVSAAELEDRIQIAVNRVNNGPAEVLDTLKKFYPNISQGDIYAYILDPKKALPVLQRQVTAAEIGAEAVRNNLGTSLGRADELAGLGVNQQTARQGYAAIGGGLERGRQLGDLYGENYDQDTAEQEVFGMNDANKAANKRRKIIDQETATFGGSSGIRGGALDANRAGTF